MDENHSTINILLPTEYNVTDTICTSERFDEFNERDKNTRMYSADWCNVSSFFFFSFLYFSSFRFVSIWQFTQKLGKKFFDAKSGMVSSRFGIWLKWRLNVLNFVSCNRNIYFEFLFLITWWRKLNFEFIEFLFLSVKVNGKFFDKQDCRIGLCRSRTFIEFLSLEEDGKIVF